MKSEPLSAVYDKNAVMIDGYHYSGRKLPDPFGDVDVHELFQINQIFANTGIPVRFGPIPADDGLYLVERGNFDIELYLSRRHHTFTDRTPGIGLRQALDRLQKVLEEK